MSAHSLTPDERAIQRKNRWTLFWLTILVFASASLAYIAREALYPVFFKY